MSISEMKSGSILSFVGEKAKSDKTSTQNNYSKIGRNMLNTALQSVERQFNISQSVKEQAEEEYIDAEFRRNLLEDEEASSGASHEHVEHSGPEVFEQVSARILELNSKKSTAHSVYASMIKGAEVLKAVAERSGQMTSYLEKLEIDIERLEAVEAHAETLKSASAKLAQDHREQTIQNTELKQTVDQLTIQSETYRKDLEALRLKIDRVVDEKQGLENVIATQRASIVKLENDKSSFSSKLELWDHAHSELKVKHDDATKQIKQQSDDIQDREKKIAHQQIKLQGADENIEQQRIELAEIRAKFEQANSANVSTKAQLGEAHAQLESERRENEAKCSRQSKRIAELETQNQVLNRQIAINDDLIANMDYQLKGGAKNPPACENPKKKSKAKRSAQVKAASKKSVAR